MVTLLILLTFFSLFVLAQETSQTSETVKLFENLPGVSSQLQKFTALLVPPEEPILGYDDLIERSIDPNIRRKALFAKSEGYLRLAELQHRHYYEVADQAQFQREIDPFVFGTSTGIVGSTATVKEESSAQTLSCQEQCGTFCTESKCVVQSGCTFEREGITSFFTLGTLGTCIESLVTCREPSQEERETYISEALSRTARLSDELLRAVILAESNFKHCSSDGTILGSSAGAQGYMQIIPSTAKSLNIDPKDPQQNILGGADLLEQLLVKYSRYQDGEKLAIANYNCGGLATAVNQYCRDTDQLCWPTIEPLLAVGGEFCQEGKIILSPGKFEGQTKEYVNKISCFTTCYRNKGENCLSRWDRATQTCSS